ncbi:MAG: phosphorylase [Rhodocyclaceae bacterium]|nr:phosphorylase [Rhodocyclaceae bacterium]
MNDEFSQSRGQDANAAVPILTAADAALRRASASGALQAIRTSLDWVDEAGFRFPVRWVDALERKRKSGPPGPASNPFLPWDPELEVAPAGPDHVVLLNKFPVMDRHLLVITRGFVSQDAPLGPSDFRAIAPLLAESGGLAFYNGGRTAGASQPHRHLQWIPSDDVTRLPLLAEYEQCAHAAMASSPRLPFCHRIANCGGLASADAMAQRFHASYLELCEQLGILGAGALPAAYNLLFTSDAMIVVPRARECVEEISLNALGFAGSLFVPRPEMIDRVRRRGPLALLAAATRSP